MMSYTQYHLESILKERVGPVVDESATLLSQKKKAAAAHGDARKTTRWCREALSLAKRKLEDSLNNAVLQK